MRVHPILLMLIAATAILAADATVPFRAQSFSRDRLLRTSSLQLANPSGFQMQQSYSVQFTSSSQGSASSGLYLNTLSYRFGIPLTLSVDVGMYNLLYAATPTKTLAQPSDTKPELLIPRVALEYKPTENTLLSVELVRGNDALKAYGLSPYSNFSHANWLAFR